MNKISYSFIGIIAVSILLIDISRSNADESPVRRFFNAVETGNVESVKKLMHPQLASQIDPPILEAWLQAVSFRLGPVVDIIPEFEKITQNAHEHITGVQFKKGKAQAIIKISQGNIVRFEVKSDKLINWFQRPTSLKFYQLQGEQFLKELQAQNYDSTSKLLHKKVASQLSENDLKAYSEKIITKAGKVESTHYRFAKLTILPNEQLQQIDLFYEIRGDQGSVQAELAIRFQGMKGYIMGFEFYDTLKE